jgi:hypothetical protein
MVFVTLLNYVLQTFLSSQLPFESAVEEGGEQGTHFGGGLGFTATPILCQYQGLTLYDKTLFFDFGQILRPRSCHRQTVFTAGGAAPGLEAVHVN